MAIKAMKIHPFCRLFGQIAPLSKEELADLTEDVKKNGVQVPILVNKKRDTILDGATRWGIAYDLGLQPVVLKTAEVFRGKDEEIEGVILSRNFYRRHMNDKERSEIVSKVLGPKYEKEAKERQSAAGSFTNKKEGKGKGKEPVVAQLATIAGVGVHTQKQSEKLRKAGLLDNVIAKKQTRASALKEAGTKRRKPRKEPEFNEDTVYKKWLAWLDKFGTKKRTVMELVRGWLGPSKKNGNGSK